MQREQDPAGVGVADRIALGALMRVFPPAVVDQAIAQHGRQEERKRLLPARVVVYFILAMTLFSGSSYREVMRKLTEGLRDLIERLAGWTVPTKGSIAEARQRLGVEPLRTLFDMVARPLAAVGTRGAWFRGRWRVAALDGSTVNIADTKENEAAFGRPGNSKGERSAYPQARLVTLAECGTHAFVDFVYGALNVGETTLARRLLKSLQAGTLCLADRNFYSFDLWTEARQTGVDLLWRVKKNLILEPIKQLADRSYLSYIYPSPRARERGRDGVMVRVIEFVLDNPQSAQLDTYRLITSILDPKAAPAHALAVLYCERWELEIALDELKTHQRGPGVIFRSRTPEGVEQEICSYFLTHYAIRAIMYDAAEQGGVDPDRISFTAAIHVIRRKIIAQGVFFPRWLAPPPPASGG